jgi:hypothetical protein
MGNAHSPMLARVAHLLPDKNDLGNLESPAHCGRRNFSEALREVAVESVGKRSDHEQRPIIANNASVVADSGSAGTTPLSHTPTAAFNFAQFKKNETLSLQCGQRCSTRSQLREQKLACRESLPPEARMLSRRMVVFRRKWASHVQPQGEYE